MIPIHVQSPSTWDAIFAVVQNLFDTVGAALFGDTFLAYYVLLVLLIGIALWVWRWFKGA